MSRFRDFIEVFQSLAYRHFLHGGDENPRKFESFRVIVSARAGPLPKRGRVPRIEDGMQAPMLFDRKYPQDSAPSARTRRTDKAFKLTLERLLGERIRMDAAFAVELWSALANTDWRGPDGATVQYSFRDAGSVVAWIRVDRNQAQRHRRFLQFFILPVGLLAGLARQSER